MFANCEFYHVLQVGLAQMLKGGVIMDVTNVEEARIAEEAGAVAVMALERVPAGVPLWSCRALAPFTQEALMVVVEIDENGHCFQQHVHRT
jgi:pyridoxal biosynthesis lyase PdxS